MRLQLFEHESIAFPSNIARWAAKRGHKIAHTAVYQRAELPSMDVFDWLIVAGGSQHVWEEEVHPWLSAEKRFIAQALAEGKVVLGICLGAQLLAKTLGGRVSANPHVEIGWHEVSLTPAGRQSFLFKQVPDPFMIFHWHSDHFTLPPGCTRLACNVATANQAFISRDYPAVGLQFHPDFSRAAIVHFGRHESHHWGQGPFNSARETVLSQTPRMPETDWLMDKLLDNMVQEYQG
ncbi:MAG: type 1 glutamine amidotransferase [Desulfobacterales bacterium]|nr:MAG: type 1 glutamine amidotransferase [Desulfobacterales bacterium]